MKSTTEDVSIDIFLKVIIVLETAYQHGHTAYVQVCNISTIDVTNKYNPKTGEYENSGDKLSVDKKDEAIRKLKTTKEYKILGSSKVRRVAIRHLKNERFLKSTETLICEAIEEAKRFIEDRFPS